MTGVRETDPAERQLRRRTGPATNHAVTPLVRETDPAERQLRRAVAPLPFLRAVQPLEKQTQPKGN